MSESGGPIFEDGRCVQSIGPFWDLEVDDETKHQRVRRHATAKSICAECPALIRCAKWAQDNAKVAMGVWGERVYAPSEFKYPRCLTCDFPLAVTMTAVYRLSSGYALPHPLNLAICVNCGVRSGLPRVTSASRFDGVREIVANSKRFRITNTVTRKTDEE